MLDVPRVAGSRHFLVAHVDDPIGWMGLIAVELEVTLPMGCGRHDVQAPCFAGRAQRGSIEETEAVLLFAEGDGDRRGMDVCGGGSFDGCHT